MSRKYRCPIYMEHARELVDTWRGAVERQPRISSNDVDIRLTLTACADELEAALRQDQHDLFHDGEFADGCDICDEERRVANS
jgi:hypothetical protein